MRRHLRLVALPLALLAFGCGENGTEPPSEVEQAKLRAEVANAQFRITAYCAFGADKVTTDTVRAARTLTDAAEADPEQYSDDLQEAKRTIRRCDSALLAEILFDND